MHYQVQEMLRAERIFEPADIEAELEAYNPLIPDGSNWKATLSIEYPDVDERRVALEQLVGIEDRIWVQVADGPVIFGIADEDLERSTASKTSAVHFLRFELPAGIGGGTARRCGAGGGCGSPATQAPHRRCSPRPCTSRCSPTCTEALSLRSVLINPPGGLRFRPLLCASLDI